MRRNGKQEEEIAKGLKKSTEEMKRNRRVKERKKRNEEMSKKKRTRGQEEKERRKVNKRRKKKKEKERKKKKKKRNEKGSARVQERKERDKKKKIKKSQTGPVDPLTSPNPISLGLISPGPCQPISVQVLWTPKQPKPNQFGLHYSLFTSPIRIGLPKNPKPNSIWAPATSKDGSDQIHGHQLLNG
jgi:hypothetical protein